MNKLMPFVAILFVAVGTLFADTAEEIVTARKELAALKRLRQEKLDLLENAEAARWNQRYKNTENINLLKERSRLLENNYARLAGDLNRKQEDILLLKNALDEARTQYEDMNTRFSAIGNVLLMEVDKFSDDIASGFPWNTSMRTAIASDLREKLEQDNPPFGEVMETLLRNQLTRLELSATQELLSRPILFFDGTERSVWTLRLGTIHLTDLDKNSEHYQTLLRTGALRGTRYSYRTGLSSSFSEKILAIVSAPKKDIPHIVPIDVLQNGKLGVSAAVGTTVSTPERIIAWFNKGGLIMYPLVLIAVIALLISLERFITLTIKHSQYNKSYKRIIPLIESGKWDQAIDLCKKRATGLTRAIREILVHRGGSRENAEQHVKQILLNEVPALEKRLSIISALGATAPLLGLLGTVTGMITLFRVITETGTNDARILAGGISEALITTQTGLIVAIPILLIHGYLMEQLDDILSHYNETVLETFNLVFNKGTSKA